MAEYTKEEKEEMSANQSHFINRWGALIVQNAGDQCKGGAYSYPGALDRYEKALGLKPAEAWLMKRLLSFDWDGKRYVWCSLRKISNEADVSYGEILKLMKSLEVKGYVRDAGQHGDGAFSQVRDWSLFGLLRAIEYTIKCDPSTLSGKELANRLGHPVTMADFWEFSNGPQKGKPFEPYKPFTTPKQTNEYNNALGRITGWDPFYGGSTDIPKPEKKTPIEHICGDCGKPFKSGSRNPNTRCTKCRKVSQASIFTRISDGMRNPSQVLPCYVTLFHVTRVKYMCNTRQVYDVTHASYFDKPDVKLFDIHHRGVTN